MYGIPLTYSTSPTYKGDPAPEREGQFMEFQSGYSGPRFVLFQDRSTSPGSWGAVGLHESTAYLEDFIRYIRAVEKEAQKRKHYGIIKEYNTLWSQVAGAVADWTKSTCSTDDLLDAKVKELKHKEIRDLYILFQGCQNRMFPISSR
jgi:hypothetical protein